MTNPIARPDVAAAFPHVGENQAWGFQLRAQLPAGAHALTLLAAEAGSHDWQPLQRLTATVLSRGLQASIEFPSEPVITESVRVQGWAAHPDHALREVWLHYGTRRVACTFGLPRSDVPGFLPTAPNAAQCGFITTRNARAGRSSLRVIGIDAEGTRHVARTDRTVDINQDEENPRGLNLPAQLARVSAARQGDRPAENASAAMPRQRVLFVLYGDFTSNSAVHVVALANHLIELGHECIVAVPEQAETVSYHRGARFKAVSFSTVPRHAAIFENAQPPNIIHAWTTRENVRQFCLPLREATGATLVVHLEDHELRILELNTGRSLADLVHLRDEVLNSLVPATLSHPRHGPEFLAAADGVTIITEKLREFVPPGKPVQRFWPAAASDVFFPRPVPQLLRATLGWGSNHIVLFYHGNVHAANQREMRELYLAVAKLNAAGQPTTLLRSGRDFCDFLGDDAAACRSCVLSLGQIEQHHHLAPLMALADFFVQPGEADAFNDYRFPSKLPEFFALGRPVILPLTNLGREVRHGDDAYVLPRADAAGIARAVQELWTNPALRERLGAGAVAFAERNFSWRRSAADLLVFYEKLSSALRSKTSAHAASSPS